MILKNCVNALHRASSISTRNNMLKDSFRKDVSMPYIGLLLFLLCVWQAPLWKRLCVNALHRASSISTYYVAQKLMGVILCQCPTSGFFYFYAALGEVEIEQILCQCPTSGFFYFYLDQAITDPDPSACVNALHRASSISTAL